MSKEKPHRGVIEQWIKLPHKSSCMDDLGFRISGLYKGHPNQREGENAIITSFVVMRRGNEIETNNSRYTLGTPCPTAD